MIITFIISAFDLLFLHRIKRNSGVEGGANANWSFSPWRMAINEFQNLASRFMGPFIVIVFCHPASLPVSACEIQKLEKKTLSRSMITHKKKGLKIN